MAAASSIRRYAADWRGYLSEHARKRGKKRRYTDQDVLILSKIRELTKSRKSTTEIKQALQVVDKQDPGSALALLPHVADEFDNIRSHNARQDERIDRLEQLAKELEEERGKSFWKRLFGG